MFVLQKAKALALEYRQLTGKPLGITGEVAVIPFIDHVVSFLTDDARDRLATLLSQDYLGRCEVTGEVTQLFGSAVGEMVLRPPRRQRGSQRSDRNRIRRQRRERTRRTK